MELQEKIDHYLLDKLSPSEKVQFEELVSKDTLLKNEVNLQRSISNVLNESGSVALKARLNSMPVSMASTGNNIVMKWVGAGVAASLLAGFIIFLLPSQEEFQNKNNNIVKEQTAATPNTSVVQESNSTNLQNSNAVEKTTTKEEVASDQVAAKQVTKKIATTPKLEAYKETTDFSDMTNGDIAQVNQNTTAPSSNLTSESNKLSSLSVNINNSNSNDKSYQFDGTKLTLFGDFASHPYELLELNNKGQKILFLSYQTEFYELIWSKSSKTPLKKVSDKSTIEKLKQINN